MLPPQINKNVSITADAHEARPCGSVGVVAGSCDHVEAAVVNSHTSFSNKLVPDRPPNKIAFVESVDGCPAGPKTHRQGLTNTTTSSCNVKHIYKTHGVHILPYLI